MLRSGEAFNHVIVPLLSVHRLPRFLSHYGVQLQLSKIELHLFENRVVGIVLKPVKEEAPKHWVVDLTSDRLVDKKQGQ